MVRRAFLVLGLAARTAAGRTRQAVLGARMALWVVVVSAVAQLITLPRVQRVVAFRLSDRSGTDTPEHLARTIDRLLARNVFVWTPSCWKRAMVLHRFLALNGVDSQINFGIQKTAGRGVNGHAWLQHRGRPLLEKDACDYVVTFSLPLPSSNR